jgi:hypothetical protein
MAGRTFRDAASPDDRLSDAGCARNHRDRHAAPVSLLCAGRRSRDPLRHRGGPRRLHLVGRAKVRIHGIRIHGTSDPTRIGKKVSSGCVRLTNEDVIDLYGRTTLGAKAVVLPDTSRCRQDEDAARSEDRRMWSGQAPQPGAVASGFGIY